MSTIAAQSPQKVKSGTAGTLVSVLLLVIGLITVLLAVSATGDIGLQILFGSLAVFLIGLAGAIAMARDQGLLRSLATGQLGPLFAVSAAVIFGLASLPWIGDPPAGLALLISRSSVLAAMVVVAVAIACFMLTYLLVPSAPTRSAAAWLRRIVVTEQPVKPGQGSAWLLAFIALIVDAGFVLSGNFGYFSNVAQAVSSAGPLAQPLAILGTFSVFAVALSAHDYGRRRGLGRLASLALLLLVQSSVGLLSGNKEPIALGFIAAFLGYAPSVRRLPLAPLLVSILAFVFVVVPFTTNARAVANTGDTRLSPVLAFEAFAQYGIGSLIFSNSAGGQSPEQQTLTRLSRIGDVAIIVQDTPSSIPYRPLSELLEAPVLGLVPRVVWPNKLILDIGYVFSLQYYHLPTSVYTSSAVTPEGDLWRHGGWPVLIGGLAIMGLGVRVLDTATRGASEFPLRLLLVLSFFSLIVKHETDAVSLVATIPSLLVGVAVASRLTVLRTRDDRPQLARAHGA